ncbi:MAG: serine/threonine protein kinase [Sumerlaeia bacterium]
MPDNPKNQPPKTNDTSEIARNVPENPNATICCINNQSLTFVARSDEDFSVTMMDSEIDVTEYKPESLVTDNSFEFSRKFAEGGFGEVWQGSQNSLGRTIAIKRLRDVIYEDIGHDLTTQRFYEESFLREAIITAKLEHPNIVPIYDFGLDHSGKPLLAMKLVNGRPWGEMLKADRKMGVDDFLMLHLPILISVCQAVAFAHSKGILHRDLKPSQVMVGEFNEVLLMDWGLALVYDSTQTPIEVDKSKAKIRLATKETSGNPAGTISFMAPEQTLEHGDSLGPWTDIYLLGGILYYLLTGYPPHHSPDSAAAFMHAKMGYVEPPRELVKNKPIPLDLAEIAMKAMAPEKEDRLKTVHEMIAALERFLISADHRKQSRDLVTEAEEKFAEAGSSYSRIGQSMALVERAVGLWPSNPAGGQLKQKIYKQYTELALRNNDLIMAKTQVEQMDESPEKTLLTAKVISTMRRAKIQTIALRTFMVFTIIALVGVSFLSAWLNESQARAYAAQEESDKKAVETAQARKRAEDLVFFLVDDLSRELSGLYRLDLLDKIATEAMAYYDQTQIQNVELTKEDLRNRAELYRIIGDIRTLQGRLEPAKTAYLNAQETFGVLMESQNSDLDLIRASTEVEFKYAQTLILGQEIGKGEQVLNNTKKYILTLKANPKWESQQSTSLEFPLAELEASVQQLEANLLFAKGQSALAVQRLIIAETALLALLESNAGNLEIHKSLVRLYTRKSLYLLENGRFQDADVSVKKGWAYLDRLLAVVPRDPSISHLESELLVANSQLDSTMGRWQNAESSLLQAKTLTAALLTQDDLNFNWKDTHAVVLRELAKASMMRGNSTFALESVNEGLGLLQQMIQLESKDIRRSTFLATMINVRSRVYLAMNNPDASLVDLQESEMLIQKLLSTDDSLRIWGIMQSENLNLQANILMQKKDSAGTAKKISEFEKLIPILQSTDFTEAYLAQAEVKLLQAKLAESKSNANAAAASYKAGLDLLPSGFSLTTAPLKLLRIQREILIGLGRQSEAERIEQQILARS